MSPLGALHLLQPLWGCIGHSPPIWLQSFILFHDHFLISCAVCVNVSVETPYICVVYSNLSPPCSFSILTTLGANRSCQWPYPEAVTCSTFNIVWGFWKAQGDTEWDPLSDNSPPAEVLWCRTASDFPLIQIFLLCNSHASSGDNLCCHWSKWKKTPTQWLLLFWFSYRA